MNIWLHFIGKSYYPTPQDFAEEALKLKVNRRVSLLNLGGFNWGDIVFLAYGDFRTKRRKAEPQPSIIFGAFVVETVGGLPTEILVDLPPGIFELESGSSTYISRGCGGYFCVQTLKLDSTFWPLPVFARFLQDATYAPLVKPTLGGKFFPIDPPVVIPWGFRFGYTKLTPERLEQAPELQTFLPEFLESLKTETSLTIQYPQGEVFSEYSLNKWERTAW